MSDYKMIGGDGQTYGPFSADQIRTFVSGGRANADTRLQADGEGDFKPLKDFPEFAEALRGAPAASAGASSAVQTLAALQTPPEAGRQILISSIFDRSLKLYKGNLGPVTGAYWLSTLLLALAGLTSVGTFIVGGALLAGLDLFLLKVIRRQPVEIKDLFGAFQSAFLPTFLVFLVMSLGVTVGLLLCLLPGIYLGIVWMLALPLAADKNLPFWEAMELSRKTLHARFVSALVFVLVVALINVVGALPCGLGLIFTLPLSVLMSKVLYEDLFGNAAPGLETALSRP